MEDVLRILMSGEYVSGAQISSDLGVTRAAVWKRIEQLRALGLKVESAGRRGYRLTDCADCIMAPIIERNLHTAWAGRPVIYRQTIGSTNQYARQLASQGAAHGTLVVADEQTAGRGRRGRAWISPAGEGVFFSLILRPSLHPSLVPHLSLITALTAYDALVAIGIESAGIKWPNDVVANGKKVSGLLLEMDANEQEIEHIVVGIGFNVHQQTFPEEIEKTATSLDLVRGKRVNRAELVCAFLQAFEARYDDLNQNGMDKQMETYVTRSVTIGRKVQVVGTGEQFIGTATGIDESGALKVTDEDGNERTVLAGDVSVRGLMGYV